MGGIAGGRRTTCTHSSEACRLVFCAPEVAQPTSVPDKNTFGPLDSGRLTKSIQAHLGMKAVTGVEADAWSVGAITFLLLCGYPPFFAPCRHSILARIDKTDFSFDPPFWSKISEEAKDFVMRCLRAEPSERMSVLEALHHPWIESLADSSPSGPMLSSFSLNLRRFHRTARIEMYAANSLAGRLSFSQISSLRSQCREADTSNLGFFTTVELRRVLAECGYGDVADAIGSCFSRTLRQPGESYIDYNTVLDSVTVRRERLLEEELWRCYCEFSGANDGSGDITSITDGLLSVDLVGEFLQTLSVQSALKRAAVTELQDLTDLSSCLEQMTNAAYEGGTSPCKVQVAECLKGQSESEVPDVDFNQIVAELIRNIPHGDAHEMECMQV